MIFLNGLLGSLIYAIYYFTVFARLNLSSEKAFDVFASNFSLLS